MKTRIIGALVIVSGAVLATVAIFLTIVPHLILASAGKILIAVGMLILFAVKNKN